MKKMLILSSLLLSLGVFADVTAPEAATEVLEAEPNFVIKGLHAMHTKCAKAKAKYDNAEEAKVQWEAVKQDCMSLPQIPATQEFKAHAAPQEPAVAAPEATILPENN